jgi:heme A synthase
MKIILILFNILFLVLLMAVPALKKINLIRLLTIVLLLIYSIGIIKMIFLFPMSSAVSLGAGMLAVLCMALLFRQRLVRPDMKGADHKIRMLNDRRNDVRVKRIIHL